MDEHHADSNTGATRVSSIITLNLGPMMKPLGLIKIPIWVLSLLAFAVASSWECGVILFGNSRQIKFDDFDSGDFFIAIMVMSWLLSMAFMIVYVFAFDYVTSALPSNVYYSVETSISATWALLSLISGITAAQDLSDFEDATQEDACKLSPIKAGIAFAFFVTGCWIANTVFCVLTFLQARRSGGPAAGGGAAADME